MNRRRPAKRPKMAPRAKQLALIHVAAKELGLRSASDDSAYRQMLWSIGRVRSAKDLDEAGREAVLKHLRACGWVQRQSTSTTYKEGSQAALMRHIWTELHLVGAVRDSSDRALRRYLAKQLRAHYDGVDEVAPQHVRRDHAQRVIEQLKAWLERVSQ